MKSTLRSAICETIHSNSGMTQADIAKAVHGPHAYQSRVARICAQLLLEGLIRREGRGGPADPFVYFWTGPSKVVRSMNSAASGTSYSAIQGE